MNKEVKDKLFHYLDGQHNAILLDSDLNEIDHIVGLSFKEYEEIVDLTAIYPDKGKNIIYPVVSLAEEVGEVSQILSKAIRDKNGVIDDEDRKRFLKEGGDVLWYLSAIAKEAGTTLEEMAKVNYEKLISRLERNKISGSGDNR